MITLTIIYFLLNIINNLLHLPLFSLLVGTILAILFFQQAPILGEIKTGLPTPQIPVIPFNQEIIISMVKSALILAFLGTIDSLLTSLVADNITRTHHEIEIELFLQRQGVIQKPDSSHICKTQTSRVSRCKFTGLELELYK